MAFLPQFYLGFSGMPRRVHDYPVIFIGWHSMSTAGHFITLIGIFFFFLMFLDSHIEKRLSVQTTLGIPRWNKRVVYYVFKLRYLQLNKKIFFFYPNFKIRFLLSSKYYNEFEQFV
jgi:heme/copper-type cytochrome/quinol oxidase subunit 1